MSSAKAANALPTALDGFRNVHFTAFDLDHDASDERYAALAEKIAAWETARPGSQPVVIVKAAFHCDLAWRARGADVAKNVSRDNWQGFRSEPRPRP